MKTAWKMAGFIGMAGLAMPAFGQFGGFGEILSQSTGRSGVVSDLEGGDLDGDGINDIVYLDATGRVAYFPGFTDGLFDTPPVQIVEPDANGRAIELFDYDGDGDLDVVRVSAINSGDFRVYTNDGHGDFTFDFAITGIGDISVNAGLHMADFDGDEDDDVFVLTRTGVVIIENLGTDFSRTPIVADFTGFSAVALAAGDLDGDGRDDAVGLSSSNEVYVLRSTGQTLEQIATFSPGTGVRDLKLGKMDSDGDLDLVVASAGSPLSRVSIYHYDGSGEFTFAYGLTITDPDEVEVADIDGDGHIDVLVEGDVGTCCPELVTVFLNDGDGHFDRQTEEWGFVSGGSTAFEIINIDPATGPDLVGMTGGTGGQPFTVRLNQTPFFEPSAPTLLSPANGATNLALPSQVAAWGGQTRPMLSWERAEGFGVTYSVVVSESPTLASPVFELDGLTSRSADLSAATLQPGTTYYWSAFADNPRGSTGPVVGPFSFTTADAGVACQADFDGDGSLTIFDFLAFSTAFDAGCP